MMWEEDEEGPGGEKEKAQISSESITFLINV